MVNTLKLGLISSTTGMGMLAALDPVTTGEKVAQLGLGGACAVMAVACVVGMCVMYRDQRADRDELVKVIAKNAEVSQKVIDAIEKCDRARRG